MVHLINGVTWEPGNCGNLAQELTSLTKAEIHEFAMRRSGDWSEQVDEYCPTSGYPMDLLISSLLNSGLSIKDLKNLENLSDRRVVINLGRSLQRNNRQDVIDYLRIWADLLEKELISSINVRGVSEYIHRGYSDSYLVGRL